METERGCTPLLMALFATWIVFGGATWVLLVVAEAVAETMANCVEGWDCVAATYADRIVVGGMLLLAVLCAAGVAQRLKPKRH